MAKSIKIDPETAEAAVLGGTVLGGGGGGWMEDGRKLAQTALKTGFSEILPLESLPADALLLTVSAVGAPSAGAGIVSTEDYVGAVEFFIQKTGLKIGGLISSEIGGLAVANGWVQSSILKIPVVDAPCNGRAHPLGLMGSMGLNRIKEYISLQAAVGGQAEKGNRVKILLQNSLEHSSQKVLDAAAQAKGMVAVARNPVPAKYVKENGAPGAIAAAIKLGRTILEHKASDPEEMGERIVRFFGGDMTLRGTVRRIDMQISGGLDVGKIDIEAGNVSYELTFWNEYMTLEEDGKRLATFPDLIMTVDAATNEPVISACIKENQEILLLVVSAERLILGSGVKDRKLLQKIEKTIGKHILKYF